MEIEEKGKKKKGSKVKKMIFIIIGVIVLLLLYIRFIGTQGFIVKEYGLHYEKLPESFNGLKIAHLSDIHYGTVGADKLKKIVNEVNIMKPDIVVFTGDLYDEFTTLTDGNKQELIEILGSIETKLGKYAVSGNHDYSNLGYQELVEKAGFNYLHNNSKIIYNDGATPIEIVGYPSAREDEPDYSINLTDNFKIALIHEPDEMEKLVDKDFQLVLAGHSHGGQVRLPFIGAVVTPSGSKKYYDNYYKVNNTDLYISSGLGESEYKLRFFNRPSFNFYRIYNK